MTAVTAATAPDPLAALEHAMLALESAAEREDWTAVGEWLGRQRRCLEQWLPQCRELPADTRLGLHRLLDRYQRVLCALTQAREQVRRHLAAGERGYRGSRAYLEVG